MWDLIAESNDIWLLNDIHDVFFYNVKVAFLLNKVTKIITKKSV